jgi:hypothetical protein
MELEPHSLAIFTRDGYFTVEVFRDVRVKFAGPVGSIRSPFFAASMFKENGTGRSRVPS